MNKKLMIQSDFDGTLVEDDLSIKILDEFAKDAWHPLYKQYSDGTIGLDEFNSKSFALMKVTEEEFLDYSRKNLIIRPGIQDLLETCKALDIRFHIVSNGILAYVNVFKDMIGYPELEAAASKTVFDPNGMIAWYEDPSGKRIYEAFKESYAKKFKEEGYEIIYLGDGTSDVKPSKLCDVVFARDSLEKAYLKEGLEYNKFEDLNDVNDYLKRRFQVNR